MKNDGMTIDEAAKEFMDAAGHFISKKYLAADNEAKRLISAIKFETFPELSYRLRHHDFDEHLCKICGKPLHYSRCLLRFPTYCSHKCEFQDSAVYDRRRKSNTEKYGQPVWNNPDKTTSTCYERYGSGRNLKKIQRTMMDRYGVKSFLSSAEVVRMKNSPEIQAKIQETKRKRGTFNVSTQEEQAYAFLCEMFGDVRRQFKSEQYPFNADFYVPALDLYVECNFHWTHGFHPFDPTSKADLERLEAMKEKNTKFYDNAIKTWTVRDPLKRERAARNNVKMIEFWTLEELKDKLGSYDKA